MKLYSITALTLFALGTAAPLFAAASPAPRVTALERAEAKLSRMAGQTKGGPQQRLLLERERVRRLLDDLDAGRAVDPQDIDRALQNTERAF